MRKHVSSIILYSTLGGAFLMLYVLRLLGLDFHSTGTGGSWDAPMAGWQALVGLLPIIACYGVVYLLVARCDCEDCDEDETVASASDDNQVAADSRPQDVE